LFEQLATAFQEIKLPCRFFSDEPPVQNLKVAGLLFRGIGDGEEELPSITITKVD
jgi:hypothetical protein